jgi:hypothetical protein
VSRYYTSTEVEHGCCYDACVKDSQSAYSFDPIEVECRDMETADKIAAFLNATTHSAKEEGA